MGGCGGILDWERKPEGRPARRRRPDGASVGVISAMTTREFNRRVKGSSPQASLRRWRARARLINRLEALAVLGFCVMGSAVLLIRIQQAWMGATGWHPVPAMASFVAKAEPAPAASPSVVARLIRGTVTPAAIHLHVRGSAARRWTARNRTVALVLLAALAHKNEAGHGSGTAAGSNPPDEGAHVQPVAAARAQPVAAAQAQPLAATAIGFGANAASWTGQELAQAYDQAVVFVSDQLIPEGDFGSNVRDLLVSFSARLQSLGEGSGLDLHALDEYSGGSVAMVIMAFLAALALCLLGPLYLSSRSERASHAHFFRLEGRR
jgi:hypothetical protein